MRGVILAIAPDGSYGQLSADDGQRYSYWTSEVRNGPPRIGQMVEFQMWEGQPVDIFAVAPPQQPPPPRTAPGAYGRAPAYPAAPAPFAASASRGASFPPADYWIRLFTSPSGRISRLQFWLHGVLPIVVVSVVLGWIPLLGLLVALATFWASICICFKRFHDVGYPGWWSLLNAVPAVLAMVLTVVAMTVSAASAFAWLLAEILWGLSFVVFIVQMVFVYLRVGQPGLNEYGPDPLSG